MIQSMIYVRNLRISNSIVWRMDLQVPIVAKSLPSFVWKP